MKTELKQHVVKVLLIDDDVPYRQSQTYGLWRLADAGDLYRLVAHWMLPRNIVNETMYNNFQQHAPVVNLVLLQTLINKMLSRDSRAL